MMGAGQCMPKRFMQDGIVFSFDMRDERPVGSTANEHSFIKPKTGSLENQDRAWFTPASNYTLSQRSPEGRYGELDDIAL
jgi:hypothetical protein